MEVQKLLDIHINNKTVISVVGGGGKTSLVFSADRGICLTWKKSDRCHNDPYGL